MPRLRMLQSFERACALVVHAGRTRQFGSAICGCVDPRCRVFYVFLCVCVYMLCVCVYA